CFIYILQMISYKKIKIICFAAALVATTIFANGVLLFDATAEEEKCEEQAVIELVFRNSDGKYIPDIKFEMYEQINDVDGKPKPDKKIISGSVSDKLGKGEAKFMPEWGAKYAIKAWQNNSNVGSFWFFNDLINIPCGTKAKITKYLSGINFILRDTEGNLRKNTKFSLYTQHYDADDRPIKEKEDLVGSFNTSEEGEVMIYVADHDHFLPGTIGGHYVFTADNAKAKFISYNIQPQNYNIIKFEYIFSDIVFSVKNTMGDNLPKTDIQIYEQNFDDKGNPIAGKKITTLQTDSAGQVIFEYPAGVYMAEIKDDIGQYFKFWDLKMLDNKRIKKELTTNLIRISAIDDQKKTLFNKTVDIYDMVKDEEGWYYQNNKIKSLKIDNKNYTDTSLISNPYLFTIKYKSKFLDNKEKEYGHALYAEDGKLQKITIKTTLENEVTLGKKYKLTAPVFENDGDNNLPASAEQSLTNRTLGYILLQTESNGEAWYVYRNTRKRYYIKNGYIAYQMLRQFGLGITNKDLSKIPVGLNDNFKSIDSDADGLSDKIENALGTDINNNDSDNDGHLDGTEVKYGYNPLGKGEIQIDSKLIERLKGVILLQVESKGEAWYINPQDGKRYYMKDGDSAYQIMRFLSLGITNKDLEQISEGEVVN
ncbi:MAG: hypothetical protein ABII94_01885, partial [Patescibacteria group bacterium]